MTTASEARSHSTNCLGINFQTAAVNSLRHCRARPGNPSSSKMVLRRLMDARVKPGHDECVFGSTSQFQTHVRDLATRSARVVHESSAQRGRGERRMPLAPAASCALVVVERTRVTTSTPESPGVPARNGFNGFLRALPGDRALLPPSSADVFLSKPGWADLNSANLTPASGRQDHTTSPYAATSFVRVLLIAHKPFDSPCDPVARKTLPR